MAYLFTSCFYVILGLKIVQTKEAVAAVAEIEEKEVDQEVEIEEEIEIEMLTEGKADASIARERVIRLLIAKKAETEMVVVEVETPDQAVTHPKRDTTEEADPQED